VDGVKNYLIAVCSAAILSAILKQLIGKSKMSSVTVNLLSGLFVAICIISPWKDFSLQDLEIYNPLHTQSGQSYVETGKRITQNQIDAIITEKVESYILEKTNQLHLQVEVRVELAKDGVQFKSIVSGKLSPEEKKTLSAFLEKEIGIQKEMQIWK
jgi:hypothetical protein